MKKKSEFWESAEEASKRVKSWPKWKQEGSMIQRDKQGEFTKDLAVLPSKEDMLSRDREHRKQVITRIQKKLIEACDSSDTSKACILAEIDYQHEPHVLSAIKKWANVQGYKVSFHDYGDGGPNKSTTKIVIEPKRHSNFMSFNVNPRNILFGFSLGLGIVAGSFVIASTSLPVVAPVFFLCLISYSLGHAIAPLWERT